MKKVFLFTFILSFWVFGAHGADLKIGYIDLNEALNKSDRGVKATKILEDMVSSKNEIIRGREDEIKKLKDELEKQDSVLTPESKREKKEHLNKLIKGVKRMVNDFQEEIQKKESEFRREILKELRKVIGEIGREEGYDIIFDKVESGVVYSQKKVDITEKVIKKYNKISQVQE